ncbi:hypothetical protein [Pantoea dispersa]|jgi:hypothetical protein|uniref:hypothetical protein n=1 Tax=Pantoea dispersa TaxID=59814 RepID=UPI0021F77674|nr:hypothetical protein [Pantoea dispersa]MCW0319934.1 hypothetical protein [Pantoea dispersa]MCW0324670.1 hypothetical protein [Pantoea dispersa]MCW0431602.1 hypothetical protein [Pantoea dispersa]
MDRDNLNDNVAKIQFIADVLLVTHCKEDALKMALSMISEMAGKIDTAIYYDAIFCQAKRLLLSKSPALSHDFGGFFHAAAKRILVHVFA